MLGKLGKWLRAAGHDTLIAEEKTTDGRILEIALSENRQLITRDRHFLHMKQAAPLLHYVKGNDFSSCIDELMQQLSIDWLHAPFSRCLTCNTSLEKGIEPSDKQVPPRIRKQKETFWYCPACRQFFWEGSHTARMLEQLKMWQQKEMKND